LHPFRHDVADYLSPFAVHIHFPKQGCPANARQPDEDQQRVSPQEVQKRIEEPPLHAPAFGGMEFQQIFRAKNDDDRAAPIGDGISKKRADVRGRVGEAVANNPQCEQPGRDDAQRVAVEKSPAFMRLGFSHALNLPCPDHLASNRKAIEEKTKKF